MIINKKAASLVIALTYWITLIWSATILLSTLVWTQKNTNLSERFNMAYYAAEWWIEQSRFELNLHWVWFSWWIATDTELKWILKYNWNIIWRKKWNQSWYLILDNKIDKIDQTDENLRFHWSSRRLFMNYDNSEVWSEKNIVNSCVSNSILIKFTASWSDLNVDNSAKVIYWKAEAKNWEWWTWYILESWKECEWWPIPNTDPFCFLLTNEFNNNQTLEFDNQNYWLCKDEYNNKCEYINQFISNFFSWSNSPFSMYTFNPSVFFSYVSPIFNVNNKNDIIPIKYSIEWNINNCELPTLTTDIISVWKVYWTKQEIIVKIPQQSNEVMLNYAIIQ